MQPILPPAIIVSPIQWSVDNQIAEATRSVSLHSQEVQRDGPMYQLAFFCPLWAQYIYHWALDTQAAR